MRLSAAEKRALVIAAEFLLAGEWGETIDQRQYYALVRAANKLREDNAFRIAEPAS